MQIDKPVLVAERARLLARIKEIDTALASAETGAKPVQIMTFQGRIWRKTFGITTDPDRAAEKVVVYLDDQLTRPARPTDSVGWVSAEDWAYIQAHPDQFGRISLC